MKLEELEIANELRQKIKDYQRAISIMDHPKSAIVISKPNEVYGQSFVTRSIDMNFDNSDETEMIFQNVKQSFKNDLEVFETLLEVL